MNLTAYNNCIISIGKGNYFNGNLNAIASEERAIVIGDKGLFSFGIWIRTADPHLIYDSDTNMRNNPSRDVLIGDHVWIGQDALIMKGSTIGSGSIIGGKAVVAGKTVDSNSVWGGNPAKCLKRGIFWDEPSVHAYTAEQTAASQHFESDKYKFKESAETVSMKDLLQEVRSVDDAEERFRLLKKNLFQGGLNNRFFIPAPQPKPQEPNRNRLFGKRG